MLRINKELQAELTPTGKREGIEQRRDRLLKRAQKQSAEAWHFLTTGESKGIPPYGQTWNRNYTPACYPDTYADTVPDPDMYMGTGIGALYNLEGSQAFMWQLAGWNITKAVMVEPDKRRIPAAQIMPKLEGVYLGKMIYRRASREEMLKQWKLSTAQRTL